MASTQSAPEMAALQGFFNLTQRLANHPSFQQAESIVAQLTEAQSREHECKAAIRGLATQLKEEETKTQQANEKLKDLEGVQKTNLLLKETLKAAKSLETELKNKLHQAETKLQRLERYHVTLSADGRQEIADRWFGLWRLVYELSEEYFGVDLPETVLNSAENWKQIEKHLSSTKIPLPRSNSPQGKQMRTIAAAVKVSEALVNHVFYPMEADKGLVEGMEDLASEDPDREAGYRSALLSMFDNVPRVSAADQAKNALVGDITEPVGPLLSGAVKKEFRKRLQDVYHEAQKEWRIIQGAKERYAARVGVTWEDGSVERVPLRGPSARNTPTTNGHNPSPEPASGKKKAKQPSLENIPSGTIDPSSHVANVWPLLEALGNGESIPALGLFNDQVEAAREEIKRTARRESRSGGKREEERSNKGLLRAAIP